MAHWPVLLALAALACIASAANSTGAQMCFETILLSSADQAVSLQHQESLCSLWKLNKRHVYGAQLSDDGSRLVMLSTYPYAKSTHSINYLLETYDTADGSLISSVELRQALLPAPTSTASSPVAFCATASSAFLSWSGSLQIFDRATGLVRPTSAASSYGGYIAASDRLWLACRDTAVYASVPAANAVWQLDAVDGLLVSVVARVQSPTALAIAADPVNLFDSGAGNLVLQVASDRPAVCVLRYAVGAGPLDVVNRGSFDVLDFASSSSISGAALKSVMAVDGSDSTVLAAIDDADQLRLLSDSGATSAVSIAQALGVRRAQTLLTGGGSAIVNGLPVSMWDGQPLATAENGGAHSVLLNQGNADQLAYMFATSDDAQQLVLIDQLGAALMFEAPARNCPVEFLQILAPLAGDQPIVLHVDALDPATPLLYTLAADRQMLAWRRDLKNTAVGDDIIIMQFCPDADQIERAVATNLDPARPLICALCGAAVVCGSQTATTEYFLPPDLQPLAGALRLAWGPDRSKDGLQLLAFAASGSTHEMWALDLDTNATNTAEAQWRRVWGGKTPDELVVDVNYWDVKQLYESLYLLRFTASDAVIIDLDPMVWNATARPALLHFADASLLVGAALELLPTRARDDPDMAASALNGKSEFCYGFGGNNTVIPDRRKLNRVQKSQIRIAIWAALGLMACGAAVPILIVGQIGLRLARRWLKNRAGGDYKGLDEFSKSGAPKPNPVVALLCGQQAQSMCFLACSCVPRVGAWIVKLQSDILDPARKFRRTGSADSEAALYTGPAADGNNGDDDAGAGIADPGAAAAAVTTSRPLSAHDEYHDNEAVNPAPMVSVPLDGPPTTTTPPPRAVSPIIAGLLAAPDASGQSPTDAAAPAPLFS